MEHCSSQPLLENEKYGYGSVEGKASKSPIQQGSKSPVLQGSKRLYRGDNGIVESKAVESPYLQGSKRIFDGDNGIVEGISSEPPNLQDSKRLCGGMGCKLSDAKATAADSHSRSTATCKLSSAMVLCLVFVAVEVAGGIISNSLAILTDAAHLLSDVASFAISLFAIWASSWEATPRQSYGFLRLEILGALLSIQLIWLLTGIIVYEAVYRCLHNSEQIDGRLMFIVASVGLFVNIIMALVLGHHGHGHSHGGHHGHGHHHSHSSSHGHDHGHDQGTKHIAEHSRDSDCSHSQYQAHGLEQDHDHDHNHSKHHDHHLGKDHDHDHNLDHHQGLDHEHDHNHSLVHVQVHEVVGRKRSFTVDIDMDSGNTALSKDAGVGDINVRGACLHVLGDLIQSVGVMIAGGIIWAKPEWQVVDVICTFFFSILVLATTVRMLRDIMEILMESTPREIDVKRLENGFCKVPGVIAIHDLHVWALTLGKTLLACHVTIYQDADADVVLDKILKYCEQVFNISHVTVQIERHSESEIV